MANAGYLEYDPTSSRSILPPEHVPVLAQEAGPVFFGGVHEEFVGLMGSFEKLLGHIRNGGGLSLDDYPDTMRMRASTASAPGGLRTCSFRCGCRWFRGC
jgi:hypothetical protein